MKLRADQDRLTPVQWLTWFLQNHDNAPLIKVGLWKRTGLVVTSLGPDVAAVVETAFRTGGNQAAWEVVIDALSGVDVANAPQSPDHVDIRPANRMSPGSLVGKRLRDR